MDSVHPNFKELASLPINSCFPFDVIDRFASTSPKSPALFYLSPGKDFSQTITYHELSERSHRAAIAFSRMGLQAGDRVLIQTGKRIEWYEIVLGLLRIGGVPIPGTSLLAPKDIHYRAQVSKAKFFVGDSTAIEKLIEVRKDCPTIQRSIIVKEKGETSPLASSIDNVWNEEADRIPVGSRWEGKRPTLNDPSFIFFTSGTTSGPKMCLHNHRYPFAHSATTRHWHDLNPNALDWTMADSGWAKAAWGTFATLNAGACLFVHSPEGAFSPASTIKTLHDYPINTFCAPPTVLRALVSEESLNIFRKFPPKLLGHVVAGGEPLNPYVVKTFQKETGIEINEGYGQTECVMVIGYVRGHGKRIKPGSMGMGFPGLGVCLVDANGRLVKNVGDEGDIAIPAKARKLGLLFEGYLKEDGVLDRRETKDPESGEVRYLTGDRASLDEEGYVWFSGRDDDMISSAAYRISPFEIESVLKEHWAVAESAAVASPDRARGHIVKAFVVLTPEGQNRSKSQSDDLKKELQAYVQKGTAPYKYPREVEFVETLPKTVSGKIRRVELRQLELARKGSFAKL